MRKIKIASAKNPENDFIELNDIYGVNIFSNEGNKITKGFLCTQFQTLGISREVEFLMIRNRNIPVSNKPKFSKYSLTIEIMSLYSEYERKYQEFISFLDRNKKDGIRLYYKPYDDREEKYCLCSIETSSKVAKRQPIVLNLLQDSLWFGGLNVRHTSQTQEETDKNLFVFDNDNGYFSASFSLDLEIPNYYCMAFYNGIKQQAEIKISGYNEVPLNIRVHGKCVNPQVFLYRKNDNNPIKQFQVFETIEKGRYLEINSGILENGVWEVDLATGEKIDLTELVDYSNGSPYFYLENGEYYIVAIDGGGNECVTDISWQEEYNE